MQRCVQCGWSSAAGAGTLGKCPECHHALAMPRRSVANQTMIQFATREPEPPPEETTVNTSRSDAAPHEEETFLGEVSERLLEQSRREAPLDEAWDLPPATVDEVEAAERTVQEQRPRFGQTQLGVPAVQRFAETLESQVSPAPRHTLGRTQLGLPPVGAAPPVVATTFPEPPPPLSSIPPAPAVAAPPVHIPPASPAPHDAARPPATPPMQQPGAHWAAPVAPVHAAVPSAPAPAPLASVSLSPSGAPKRVPNANPTLLGGVVQQAVAQGRRADDHPGRRQRTAPLGVDHASTYPSVTPGPEHAVSTPQRTSHAAGPRQPALGEARVSATPSPVAPAPERPRGMSLGTVLLVLFGTVAVVSAAVLLVFWRRSLEVTAVASIDASGKDSLELTCARCDDGTELTVGTDHAVVAQHKATVTMSAPLAVGQSSLALAVRRPGASKPELIALSVTLDFRFELDYASLASYPPALTVKVQSLPGGELSLAGKPVALDGNGFGKAHVAVGSLAQGLAANTERGVLEAPYTYRREGVQRSGALRVDVAVQPLRLLVPKEGQVVLDGSLTVVGQARPNAELRIGTHTVHADEEAGLFETSVKLVTGSNDIPIAVLQSPTSRDKPASGVARGTRITVYRASDRSSAWHDTVARMKAAGPVELGELFTDPAAHSDRVARVEGAVVGAETKHGETVVLIDAAGSCNTPPCLLRMASSELPTLKRGDKVRGIGRVRAPREARTPELDAWMLGRAADLPF